MPLHTEMIQGITKQRRLSWDEENRLLLSADEEQLAGYVYDAAGCSLSFSPKRSTHKASGTTTVSTVNGLPSYFGNISSMTLYPSELITVSTGMYTKHYYNGSQRLASRIGGGFAPHPDLNHYDPLTDQVELPNSGDYHHKALALVELWTRQAECAGLQPSLEFSYSLAEGNLHNPLSEPADGERYFYHSDHLGSSAFITSENGYATQFLAYMPFGETLNEEQNSSNYYSPFKFSAKEKDSETGYSYFGARYYSPELSVWLSVDPLADHPNQVDKSPYAAFWNNPVKYNDPDGRCPRCEEEMPDAPMNTVYRPEGSSLDWIKGADGKWTGLGGDLNEVSVTASPLQSGATRDDQSEGGVSWNNFSSTFGNIDGALTIGTGAKGALLDYAAKTGSFSNGVKTYRNFARGAGTGVAIFSGAVAVTDVIVNSELNASHLLDATVTGLSFIPGAGWIIGGSYFLADRLTEMYSGQSIGDHLNTAVGGPLIDWEYKFE